MKEIIYELRASTFYHLFLLEIAMWHSLVDEKAVRTETSGNNKVLPHRDSHSVHPVRAGC